MQSHLATFPATSVGELRALTIFFSVTRFASSVLWLTILRPGNLWPIHWGWVDINDPNKLAITRKVIDFSVINWIATSEIIVPILNCVYAFDPTSGILRFTRICSDMVILLAVYIVFGLRDFFVLLFALWCLARCELAGNVRLLLVGWDCVSLPLVATLQSVLLLTDSSNHTEKIARRCVIMAFFLVWRGLLLVFTNRAERWNILLDGWAKLSISWTLVALEQRYFHVIAWSPLVLCAVYVLGCVLWNRTHPSEPKIVETTNRPAALNALETSREISRGRGRLPQRSFPPKRPRSHVSPPNVVTPAPQISVQRRVASLVEERVTPHVRIPMHK